MKRVRRYDKTFSVSISQSKIHKERLNTVGYMSISIYDACSVCCKCHASCAVHVNQHHYQRPSVAISLPKHLRDISTVS